MPAAKTTLVCSMCCSTLQRNAASAIPALCGRPMPLPSTARPTKGVALLRIICEPSSKLRADLATTRLWLGSVSKSFITSHSSSTSDPQTKNSRMSTFIIQKDSSRMMFARRILSENSWGDCTMWLKGRNLEASSHCNQRPNPLKAYREEQCRFLQLTAPCGFVVFTVTVRSEANRAPSMYTDLRSWAPKCLSPVSSSTCLATAK